MKEKAKREIKRFDPVLKNVLSSTAKTILSLAGIKVQKISHLPVEINITKRFLHQTLSLNPPNTYITLKFKNTQIKPYLKGFLSTTSLSISGRKRR
jgi:hypothetical protein